jgi:hypothetical protein
VRRGDYINDAKTKRYHGICDENYYVKALEYVMLKTGKGIRIFIFSDDINWVRDNMHLSYPIIYVSSPRIMDHEEMILMSLCEHHIIANSSFSWWGAWLGQNRDKIVVAPTQWTSSKTSTELDVLPAGWITF